MAAERFESQDLAEKYWNRRGYTFRLRNQRRHVAIYNVYKDGQKFLGYEVPDSLISMSQFANEWAEEMRFRECMAQCV